MHLHRSRLSPLIAQRYTVPDAPALTAMACVIEVADDPAHGALFCPDLR
jgi:hypothetical protein